MAPTSPAHIVLIEDNPGDVILLQEALREHKIECRLTRYADGDEALAAFSSDQGGGMPPDLILLDLNLPRVEGLDVLAALRAHPVLGTTPIAVLTSSESPRDEHQAASLGASRFIQKPTLLDEFLEQVGGAVRDLLAARGAAR